MASMKLQACVSIYQQDTCTKAQHSGMYTRPTGGVVSTCMLGLNTACWGEFHLKDMWGELTEAQGLTYLLAALL